MAVDSSVIFVRSLVSIYNQVIASTETRGTDAKIAPISELRFDSSEIATIKSVVMITLAR